MIQLHRLEGFYRVAVARGYARAARHPGGGGRHRLGAGRGTRGGREQRRLRAQKKKTYSESY